MDTVASCVECSGMDLRFEAKSAPEGGQKSSSSSASASRSLTPSSSVLTDQSLFLDEFENLEPSFLAGNLTATQNIGNANPYAHWECGFGFSGQLDEPGPISNDKLDFLIAIKDQLKTVRSIQDGLNSYVRAIHSGEYHDFDQAFLDHQNNATIITVTQLQEIAANLSQIVHEVENLTDSHTNQKVSAHLVQAFAYAQPWIIRSRAILVSAHVFYKINYVLGNDKINLAH